MSSASFTHMKQGVRNEHLLPPGKLAKVFSPVVNLCVDRYGLLRASSVPPSPPVITFGMATCLHSMRPGLVSCDCVCGNCLTVHTEILRSHTKIPQLQGPSGCGIFDTRQYQCDIVNYLVVSHITPTTPKRWVMSGVSASRSS